MRMSILLNVAKETDVEIFATILCQGNYYEHKILGSVSSSGINHKDNEVIEYRGHEKPVGYDELNNRRINL